MWKDSMNLIEMIRAHLTGDATDRMSSLLGESTERTRMGMSAAIPALLGGLDRSASSPDGVRRITDAVDDADDSTLDNPLGMFGTNSTGENGSGILRSILGATGLSDLTGSVGRASGLSGRSTTAMLGMLVPVIFGVLKRVKRMAGPNFDIGDLLASQRSNIAAAMPREMEEETYAGSRYGTRERVADTYAEPERVHTAGHRPSWALPLVLLAGAIALLVLWNSRARESAFAPPSTVHAGREGTLTRPRAVLSLDGLKSKYASVIQEAQAQGVRITDLHEENGNLVIKGTAPSVEALNNVWNEIRRVNPLMDDISVSLPVMYSPSESQSSQSDYNSSTQPQPLRAKPTEPDTDSDRPTIQKKPSATDNSSSTTPSGSGGQTYTVKPGDSLTSISKQFYGNTKDYKRILEANRETIGNKNMIHAGQELIIP